MFVSAHTSAKPFVVFASLAFMALVGPAAPTQARAATLSLYIHNSTNASVGFEYRASPNHPVHTDSLRPGQGKWYQFTTSNPGRAEFRIKFDTVYGPRYVPANFGIAYGGYYAFKYAFGYTPFPHPAGANIHLNYWP